MRYTIVGDGKVSNHFCQYFSLLGIDYNRWSRKQSSRTLKSTTNNSNIVLLLISDNAIGQFVKDNPFLLNKQLMHFSGTMYFEHIIGCHPLMTFARDCYDLETYQSIPFVCDKGVKFDKFFPQLNNRSFNIDPKDKAYYHAMCVMAGNFTQTLMRETSQQMSQGLQLPSDILFPYLLQNTKNFIQNPQESATGPIQRGDFTTVRKHLQALQSNSLEDIYHSFLKQSQKLMRVENEY